MPVSVSALLAVATGLLLALASPGYGLSPLAWVALVPLYRAVDGSGTGRAAALGWLAGIVAGALTLHWLARPLLDHTEIGVIGSLALTAAVVALHAVPLAFAAAAVASVERRRTPYGMLLAIVLWPPLEWLRGVGPLPFPWGHLGYTQPAGAAASQLAEWTGVYGVGALVVAVNAAVHAALSRHVRGARSLLAVTTVALMLCLAIGTWRRHAIADDNGRSLSVGIVQTDLAPRRRWSVAERESAVESALELSRGAARAGAELLVWPESAAPIVVAEDPVYEHFEHDLAADRDLRNRIRAFAREIGRPVVVSAAGRVADAIGRGDVWSARNRVVAFDPHGGFSAIYDKRVLVPFGEIVPARWRLAGLEPLTSPDLPLEPGAEPGAWTSQSTRAALLVCWEAVFPAFVAGSATSAGVLVNVTNDAWFGSSLAAEQHLAMAAFRAVENRKALIRAANGGISAVVAADGTLVERAEPGQATWIITTVRLHDEPTFYARFGDLFVAVSALAACALLVYAGRLPPTASDQVAVAGDGDDAPETDHAVRNRDS